MGRGLAERAAMGRLNIGGRKTPTKRNGQEKTGRERERQARRKTDKERETDR